MSTLLIFIVITVLVLTGILFVIVAKENTPTNKKPNSLFPIEDYPAFEDAPVAEEKPFTEHTEHTQSAKKKKYYYNNKTKSTS
jgi:hypothetical protein